MPGVSYCYHVEIHQDFQQVLAWTALQFTFTYAIPAASMVVLSVIFTMSTFKLTAISVLTPGEYCMLEVHGSKQKRAAILTGVLTATFCLCWGPDKVTLLYEHTSKPCLMC